MKNWVFVFVLFVFLVGFISAAKVSQDVLNSNDEKVKVFVKYSDNFKDSKLKSSIKSEKNLKDVSVLTLSKAELNFLSKNPAVESINLVYKKHVFLAQSVPLINATLVWAKQIGGINLTGQGETACILDTGVDFKHPDLANKNLTCLIDCVSGVNCVENCSAVDGHGHGTHVAGIIGANGSVVGVAPGAKLVGVQVCDAEGSCWDDDILAGFDWCVDNYLTYNISVISISLGGSVNYTSYCDNIDDESNFNFASRINNAVSKNISVAVATGNFGNASSINSPACITNATSVGSSTDSDLISSFSNRNNITDLFAPGSSIISTDLSNAFQSRSGTSMATPHVSGAVLLMQQYSKLKNNQDLSVSQVETTLRNTGKIIYDSGSGLNFSRIDVYSAIAYLDSVPVVNLISPVNNFGTNVTTNFTFSCNATDDTNLVSISFSLWNSSNILINSSSISVSGLANSSSFNYSLGEGVYHWACSALDSFSNSAYSSSNFSLFIDSVKPNITLVSPAESANFSGAQSVEFRFNVSDSGVANCSLYLDNVLVNSSSAISGENSLYYSASVASHNYFISCIDFALNEENSSINNFTVNEVVVPRSGGGGGGGSSTIISDTKISSGTNEVVVLDKEIKFKMSSTIHSLTVNKIEGDSISIVIQSDPIYLNLNLGEVKKVNLDNDGFYDLEVGYLEKIFANQVNLSIKAIHEEIAVKKISNETVVKPILNNSPEINKSNESPVAPINRINNYLQILFWVVIFIFVVLFLFLIKTFFSHKKEIPSNAKLSHSNLPSIFNYINSARARGDLDSKIIKDFKSRGWSEETIKKFLK